MTAGQEDRDIACVVWLQMAAGPAASFTVGSIEMGPHPLDCLSSLWMVPDRVYNTVHGSPTDRAHPQMILMGWDEVSVSPSMRRPTRKQPCPVSLPLLFLVLIRAFALMIRASLSHPAFNLYCTPSSSSLHVVPSISGQYPGTLT